MGQGGAAHTWVLERPCGTCTPTAEACPPLTSPKERGREGRGWGFSYIIFHMSKKCTRCYGGRREGVRICRHLCLEPGPRMNVLKEKTTNKRRRKGGKGRERRPAGQESATRLNLSMREIERTVRAERYCNSERCYRDSEAHLFAGGKTSVKKATLRREGIALWLTGEDTRDWGRARKIPVTDQELLSLLDEVRLRGAPSSSSSPLPGCPLHLTALLTRWTRPHPSTSLRLSFMVH